MTPDRRSTPASASTSAGRRRLAGIAVDRALAPTGLRPFVLRARATAEAAGVRSRSWVGTAVRWAAPKGAIRPPLDRLVAKVGFEQLVVRREAIAATLAITDLGVPYGEASRALGLGRFPLSLDPTPPDPDDPGAWSHAKARALVRTVLGASAGQHAEGVKAADELAEQLAERSRSRIDGNGAFVQPALHRWVEVWFGLPGEGQHLADVAALATRAIFFNPARPGPDPDPVVLEEAEHAANRMVADLRPKFRTAPTDTLVGALREALGGDLDEVGRWVIGLSVGPLTLGTWSLTNAIAELLGTPPGLDDLATRSDAAGAYRRALRAAPPLPGVPRINRQERTVVSPLGGFTLPVGTVLAHVALAEAADPVDAEPDVDLPFSAGPHRCMGPDHITAVSAVILHRLATRRPRLIDPSRPIEPGVPIVGHGPWPFPGRLQLELAPKP